MFIRPNPWDPRFALPDYVRAEGSGRAGTITTAQAPRKTISEQIPWDGGYAIPKYVRQEPWGRGAAGTQWAPRKTIPQLIPEYLGMTEFEYIDEGGSIPLTLGAAPPSIKPGSKGDPIKAYGLKASAYILRTIKQVPVKSRGAALKALLDELEPGLYARVTERAASYKGKGLTDKKAVSAALASSLSEGFAKELIEIGKGQKPRIKSQVGMGYYGKVAQQALGISIGGIVGGAGSWIKGAAGKLGSLACDVVKNPVGKVAAGAAGTVYGVPPQVGYAGAEIASQTVCSGGGGAAGREQILMPPPPPETTPSWLLPVAIGGAGLVAVLLLK